MKPLRLMYSITLIVSFCLASCSPSTLTEMQTPTPANPLQPSPTRASLGATDTPHELPSLPIVYYYFVAIESNTYPAGSVTILPGELILGPTLSETARSSDAVTNIRSALTATVNDPRNAWESTGLSINNVTVERGAADVSLEGDFFGPGDIVLIAARMQILLTVFAEDSVQTARVTLNGENIANLGISQSSEARPVDYAFTRAEIEAFLTENAYPPPPVR